MPGQIPSIPSTVSDRKSFRKLMRKVAKQVEGDYTIHEGMYVFPEFYVELIGDTEVKVHEGHLDVPEKPEGGKPPRTRKKARTGASTSPTEPTKVRLVDPDKQWQTMIIELSNQYGLDQAQSDGLLWYCFDLKQELDADKIMAKLTALDITPTAFTRLNGDLLGLGPLSKDKN